MFRFGTNQVFENGDGEAMEEVDENEAMETEEVQEESQNEVESVEVQ